MSISCSAKSEDEASDLNSQEFYLQLIVNRARTPKFISVE